MREERNATLKPDVLDMLAEQARVEGRTVDDLLDEAARKLIESRRSISELQSFVARNRKDMEARGVKESDIAAEIAADRKERRR